VKWELQGNEVWIESPGIDHWSEPQDILDAGNSGTTLRLMLGAVAGCPFSVTFTGDSSLRSRPMRRVTAYLEQMGAKILGRDDGNYAPLTIRGGKLQGGRFKIPMASAQVKSAIILAGLSAVGETSVEEPAASRDHTERMLKAFGADLKKEGNLTTVIAKGKLTGQTITVPGDISSAAFFIVLASLVPAGELCIRDVGINPTRTGIIDALSLMGADITIENVSEEGGEPKADLRIRPARLKGIEIGGELIPRLIDEIPVLAVAASLAEGTTVIKNGEELRVKETDRIRTVVEGLTSLGADIEELPDGMVIRGKHCLRGGQVNSHGDHRLAMAWSVAGVLSRDGVSVEGTEAVAISFPDFFACLERITAK